MSSRSARPGSPNDAVVTPQMAGASAMARRLVASAALPIALLLASCAGPLERVETEIRQAGYQREIVTGGRYRHVVIDNGIVDPSRPLRVYIEGDGSPYRSRSVVAEDPTPRKPLMLELFRLETGPAVYVGRPCYLGLSDDPPCTPRDWTVGRFSDEIVVSMMTVIERLVAARGGGAVLFYGHSGGGALAALIARRLDDVAMVVTLAGNLDPPAWTALHGYSPLTGSLNPLDDGPLRPGISQFHFAGADDRNIPAALIDDAARRLGAVGAIVLPEVTHTSGWQEHWSAITAATVPD